MAHRAFCAFGNEASLSREEELRDGIDMTIPERANVLHVLQIPHMNAPGLVTGRELLPVRKECHRPDVLFGP